MERLNEKIANLLSSTRKKRDHLFSSLLLPSAHEHSDNYFHWFICDEYLVFLTARRIITTLLLDEIYPLQLGFDRNSDRCLIADVIVRDINLPLSP